MKPIGNKIPIPLDKKSVSMTLFVPLCPKAVETKRKNPIIVDNKAVEIMERIDMNCKAHVRKRAYHSAIVRTYLIDKGVKEFLTLNPKGLIINLGCGLDTKISRVDNGTLRWVDVDLPDVIEFRKKFFNESERITFIAKSVLDFSWIDDIKTKNTDKVLIIAEGLLCYFTDDEVRRIFSALIEHFPHAEMYMTLVHKFLTGKKITSSVSFTWGLERPEEILEIDNRIRLIDFWRTSDFFKNRQYFPLRLFSAISHKGKNLNRILH
jgi:O-methyltransferase involved in polyketide biosynthesis